MNEQDYPPLPYIDPYFPEPITADLLQGYADFAVKQALAQKSARHREELLAYEVTVGNLRAPREQSQPERKPMTESEMIEGRERTFSVDNPYCPCDRKTFMKVAWYVEAFHGIKEKP